MLENPTMLNTEGTQNINWDLMKRELDLHEVVVPDHIIEDLNEQASYGTDYSGEWWRIWARQLARPTASGWYMFTTKNNYYWVLCKAKVFKSGYPKVQYLPFVCEGEVTSLDVLQVYR